MRRSGATNAEGRAPDATAMHARATARHRGAPGRALRLAVVCGLALAILLAIRARTAPLLPGHPDFANAWDHHKYIWMAEQGPFGFHLAPFCWRIGTPLLARLLPFSTPASFGLIALLSLWASAVAVYALARRGGFAFAAGVTGMLLFLTQGWMVRSNLYNIWKPDPLAACISLLAILAALERRHALFALLLALGVTVKESVLFVAPLHYALATPRVWNARALGRTALLTLPAIAVLLALRALIPMRNDDPAYIGALPDTLRIVQLDTSRYDLAWLWHALAVPRLRAFTPRDLVDGTIGVFGLAPLALACLAPRRSLRTLARWSPFLVLVAAQVLFATNAQKLLALGFPFVVLAALGGADETVRRLRAPWAAFGALALVLVALSLTRSWILIVPGRIQAALLAACLAACAVWRWWNVKGGAGSQRSPRSSS